MRIFCCIKGTSKIIATAWDSYNYLFNKEHFLNFVIIISNKIPYKFNNYLTNESKDN